MLPTVCEIHLCLLFVATLSASEACDLTDGFSETAARLVSRLRLSDERLRVIPHVIKHVEQALNSRWPGSRVFAFGSTVSGLALQSSDIDCFARLPDHTASAIDIEQVKDVFEQYPDLFADFRTVPEAAVPIVSFKHIPSGFLLDLNYKTIEGLKNTELVRHLVHADQCVFRLAFIVKYWAKVHSIIGPRKFPSYGIVMLVIFYLQQKQIIPPVYVLQENAKPYFVDDWNMGFDEIVGETRYDASLYQLMGGFFEYYDSFDFEENIISTFVARPVKRRLFEDLRNVPGDFSLYRHNVGFNITKPLNVYRSACIQNPFMHNKNLGEYLETGPGSRLRTQLRRALIDYRETNKTVFLDKILSAEQTNLDKIV